MPGCIGHTHLFDRSPQCVRAVPACPYQRHVLVEWPEASAETSLRQKKEMEIVRSEGEERGWSKGECGRVRARSECEE